MALAGSWVNYLAQKGGGATWSADVLPLHIRLANAVVSYVCYISKTFWPSDLAIIYPYETNWPLWFVLAAALVLAVWSVTAVLRAQKNPFLFFGWFYFLGTLVPVIGLVQAGPQAMADRYSYLPSIGLLILIVWGADLLLATQPQRKKIAALAGAAALCACLLATSRQLTYWASDIKLYLHAVEVTPDNYVANAYLGGALEDAGQFDAALPFYFESVRITPYFPIAQWRLGIALLRRNNFTAASEHLGAAAKLVPADPVIQCYYGKALAADGKTDAARTQFLLALRLKPDYGEAQTALAALK